jgi:hypothetical protein
MTRLVPLCLLAFACLTPAWAGSPTYTGAPPAWAESLFTAEQFDDAVAACRRSKPRATGRCMRNNGIQSTKYFWVTDLQVSAMCGALATRVEGRKEQDRRFRMCWAAYLDSPHNTLEMESEPPRDWRIDLHVR